MGAHYFSKEDYYSQEKGPAKPEFFGKGPVFLGIKSEFNQITFQSLLAGKSPDGSDLRLKKKRVFSEKGKNSYDLIHKKFDEDLKKLSISEDIKNKLSNTFLEFKSTTHLDKNESFALKENLTNLFHDDEKSLKKTQKVVDKYVKQVSKENDRAGIDLTFSAPKSVSITTLIGGNKDLLEAHKKAVKFTLSYIEENYIGTRSGPKSARVFEKTGRMVAATFHHGTSRLQDPQLHTHCVVLILLSQTSFLFL